MDENMIGMRAQRLIGRHGGSADVVAIRRAQYFNRKGDLSRCHTWLQVLEKVRELQDSVSA